MLMNTKRLAIAATALWASVAVSQATPADAMAYTTQVGDYAYCSSSSSPTSYSACGYEFNFVQQIRFGQTECSSGGCAPSGGSVWTESGYTAGRKTAELVEYCGTRTIYGLGSCAC
jgi:hypothetical protein